MLGAQRREPLVRIRGVQCLLKEMMFGLHLKKGGGSTRVKGLVHSHVEPYMTSKGFIIDTVERRHGGVCRMDMRIDGALNFNEGSVLTPPMPTFCDTQLCSTVSL